MNNQNLFYAFDGDDIGRHHAQAILSDNVEDIAKISSEITAANEMVKEFVESNGGRMISFGGDEGLFEAPAEFVDLLEELRKDYEYIIGATLSIGYGSQPSEAGKALLTAKERGKNQVVQYDESVEEEAQKVQSERDEEHGPLEKEPSEKVLPEGSDSAVNEPTLCEPPKKDNNMGYDSGYKNSSPQQRTDSYRANDETPPIIEKPNLKEKPRVKEAASGDLQECNRRMNEVLPDPEDEEPMDKKPIPIGYDGQAEGNDKAPDSMAQPQDKPSDIKYDGEQEKPSSEIPIENATSDEAEQHEEESMEDGQHCPSCTCEDHENPVNDILDQHIDNASDMESEMDNENAPDSAEQTLDDHLDNQADMMNDMEDGVSRPADFDEREGDLGLSEEDNSEPNLDEVLRGGLDQHAQEIQKEKVLQLVGSALEGFKAQKPLLDKAKDQAPELYNSCIQMLKAMIELCSLAGLDSSSAEQEVNEIEADPQEKQPQEAVQEEEPQQSPQQ